jgi:3'-5' exoribonuclease
MGTYNAIGHFEAMDYILVRGQVTTYQGSNQLNIQQIRKAQKANTIWWITCKHQENIDGMYRTLLEMVEKTEEPHLKKLAQMVFVEDQDFAREFKVHSEQRAFTTGILEDFSNIVCLCKDRES